jgi:hypothetical protein
MRKLNSKVAAALIAGLVVAGVALAVNPFVDYTRSEVILAVRALRLAGTVRGAVAGPDLTRVSATVVGVPGLSINGTTLTSTGAEINTLAGVTAGTVTASKAVVVDANKDVGTIRKLTVSSGTGTATLKPQGVVNVQTANAGTPAGTGETDLHTYTVPANTLAVDGACLRLRVYGTTAANANNKTIKLYWNAVAIVTQGPTAANNANWSAEMVVCRSGSGAQKIVASIWWNGAAVAPTVTTGSATDSGTIVLKTTGTNGTATANDLVESAFLVESLNQ